MLDDIKRKGTISEIIKRLSAVEGHVRKILGTVNTNIGPTGPTGAPGADGADGVNGNDGAPGVVALFDYIADQNNSGTTETDLYASTIAAGQLSQSKKLIAKYGGTFVASPTATRQLRVYFGGTAIFDSGAIPSTAASAWSVEVFIIAVSGTVIRYSVYLITNAVATATPASVGELTGLTLSNANVLKITGQAAGVGAASSDILSKLGTIMFVGAA